MHTLARVSRNSQGEEYEWATIRDTAPKSPNFGNSSHASAFVASNNRPKARLSRPPNLPFAVPAPYGLSPPESPLPIGRVRSGRSVAPMRAPHVDGRRPSVRPISTVDEAGDGDETKPGNDDGVRTGEVARLPHLKNRISTVSQYPVFVNSGRDSIAPSVDGRLRNRNRRRPMSIASTSTTGIYLAVGALPGSEPFDLVPPAQEILDRHEGRRALTHATINPPQHNRPTSLLRPMPSATDRRPVSAEQHTTVVRNLSQQRRYSLVSRMPTNYASSDTSSRRTVSVCESLESSNLELAGGEEEVVASQYAQPELDPRHMQWLEDTGPPPPPPPKDSVHLRPPTSLARTLHASSSTPNLAIHPPAMERVGIIRERSGTWYEQPVTVGREWLTTLTKKVPHRREDMSRSQQDVTTNRVTAQEQQQHKQATTRNRRTQLLALWSRIIGRAIPRVSVHNKSS